VSDTTEPALDEQVDVIVEIIELKSRYCWLLDDGELDGLVDLFTPYAVCDLGGFGHLTGTAEIRAGYARLIESLGLPGARQHSVTNPLIEVVGTRARGRWYLLTSYDLGARREQRQPVGALGRYDDEYSRQSGQWRIAGLSLRMAWPENPVGCRRSTVD
jgi:hypothetical protein